MEHWNESDPVADENFPNIVELDLVSASDAINGIAVKSSCPTETMEEVNPNGQTFSV